MAYSRPPEFNFDVPGYEDVAQELSALISAHPPPFIYIHDSEACNVTTNLVWSILNALSTASTTAEEQHDATTAKICASRANAICCFSQRLFFESVLHNLVDFETDWEDGCPIWDGSSSGLRWNENIDTFLQGLRVAHGHLCKRFDVNAMEGAPYDGVRLVLMVERAERLKETMPELLVPLARLKELVRLDLTVIFVSEIDWDSVKPPLGAAPDPYFIDVPPLTKENIISIMSHRYPELSSQDSYLYHPSLKNLYSHFISVLCDVCYPYTHDSHELEYIAAARWPGFVKPILDEHEATKKNVVTHSEDDAVVQQQEVRDIAPPSEDVRLRLMRIFTSSLSQALEALHPRLTNASDWAQANEPVPDLLSKTPMEAKIITVNPDTMLGTSSVLGHLPRLSKFILVGSFLASTNPAKSDLRMFGRGLDEKKRRRRKANTTIKPKGGVSKVAQRLLGPSPFSLDRLISILGALLEEHDAESRLPAPEFTIPGEYTETEISRVATYAAVQELTSSRLMHRTTKVEQIDGPAMFKCAISYELALALAKELKVPLTDLLWEQP